MRSIVQLSNLWSRGQNLHRRESTRISRLLDRTFPLLMLLCDSFTWSTMLDIPPS